MDHLTFTAARMLYRKVQPQRTHFLLKQAFIIKSGAV